MVLHTVQSQSLIQFPPRALIQSVEQSFAKPSAKPSAASPPSEMAQSSSLSLTFSPSFWFLTFQCFIETGHAQWLAWLVITISDLLSNHGTIVQNPIPTAVPNENSDFKAVISFYLLSIIIFSIQHYFERIWQNGRIQMLANSNGIAFDELSRKTTMSTFLMTISRPVMLILAAFQRLWLHYYFWHRSSLKLDKVAS